MIHCINICILVKGHHIPAFVYDCMAGPHRHYSLRVPWQRAHHGEGAHVDRR